MEAISILFGFPTTEAEFFARTQEALYWDYGLGLAAGRSAAQTWDQRYRKICSVAEQLIMTARRHEVVVRQSATLGDLDEASRVSDVVVVIAHWKGAHVLETDVSREAIDLILSVSRDPSHPLARVAARYAVLLSAKSGQAPGQNDPSLMALALNEAINSGTPLASARRHAFHQWINRILPIPKRPEVLIGEDMRQSLSRMALDAILGKTLVPGNCLELADGLHPALSVERALAQSFRGVVHFACCISNVLATYVKDVRGDAFQVLSGNARLLPIAVMHLIREVIEVMSASQGSYVETKLSLEHALLDHLDAAGY